MHKRNLLLLLPGLIFCLSSFSQIIDPVRWKFESKKATGNEYELIFSAAIDAPWYMYGMYVPANGPIPTTLHFEPSQTYELLGKPKEITPPVEKHDPNFNMRIALHSKTAIFRQRVKVLSTGAITIKGSVEYQACNNRQCLLPVEKEFNLALGDNLAVTVLDTARTLEKKEITSASAMLNLESDTESKTKRMSYPQNLGITAMHNEEIKSKSPWVFFFLSFLAGLLGILTPCVFPMIPMTISFFLRGSENRRKSILNGLIFGLSIIFIYTSIGIIVSLTSAGADFANQLSTHWIPNLIFFLLFITFAASFLGMFEIILPSRLTNKADQQADKGGVLAAFFMALTLVLVSFSCTGPIVGALLVEAASGHVLKPTIGMFGFSLAFALPFTLFAIFPSWLKNLPRSGGWLNSVKVVMGLILLAFGLKFLSNIDQAYHLHFLGREVYLAIWIVIFSMLGLYFLGKIKFAHDSDVDHIGVPRLLFSIASFAFVIYMVPGMFGAPLKEISSLIPPKTGHSFDLASPVDSHRDIAGTTTSASIILCDQPKYADILEMPYGLKGYFDLDQGLACAKKHNKPVFLDLKGHTCTNCKAMEAEVWSNPKVLQRLRENFLIIALYNDDKTLLPEKEWFTSKLDGKVKKTLGKKNADYLMSKFRTNTLPLYVVLDTEGNPLIQPVGYSPDIRKFIDFLDKGREEFFKKGSQSLQ